MAYDGHLFDEFVGGFECGFVSVEEVSVGVVAASAGFAVVGAAFACEEGGEGVVEEVLEG